MQKIREKDMDIYENAALGLANFCIGSFLTVVIIITDTILFNSLWLLFPNGPHYTLPFSHIRPYSHWYDISTILGEKWYLVYNKGIIHYYT